MRTRIRLTAAATLFGLLASPAAAQPAPAKPAVEVRVRSANDLLAKAEYLGDVLGQTEPARQAVGLVKALTDGTTGLGGVDPARPIGLYAFVSPAVTDGPVALMIPLADEAAFLAVLRDKANLDPKKRDDGAYEVAVPGVPTPVFVRVAHKTAYVTVQSAANVAPAALVPPAAFFAADDGAVLSARLYLDRVPADVRKVILGQFELKVADAKKRADPGETPAQQKLRAWALEQLLAAVAAALTDGREVAVRVAVEPKTDDLTAEVTFAARPGSPTATFLRGVGDQSGRTAGLPGAVGGLVAGAGVRFALPDPARGGWGPVADGLLKELVDRTPGSGRPVARMVADAVAPTVRAGVVDAEVAVGSAGPGGPLTAVAGLRVTEGWRLDPLARLAAAFVPESEARVTFDAKRVGSLSVHKAVLTNPAVKAAAGTDTVWFAVGEDVVLVSLEPDGKAIAAAAAAKAGGPAPVAAAGVSAARALLAAEKSLKPESMARLVCDVFGPAGPAEGSDAVRLSVTGGDRLTVRLAAKGKAIKLGVLVDQEMKKGE